MAEKIQFDLEVNSDSRNSQSIGDIRDEFEKLNQQLDKTTQGTEEYYNTVKRLGQLSGELEKVDRQIEALNPDRKAQILADSLSGVVGGFSAITASVELFGVENEAVLESIQRVNALLAVTEGINAFAEKIPAMKSMIASSPRLVKGLQAIRIGFQGIGTATKALGIGLVVSAIAALVTNWDSVKGIIEDTIPGLEDTGELFGMIKDGAIALGTAIVQYLATPITAIARLLKGDFQGAKDAFVNGFDVIGNTVEKFDEKQAERGLQTTIENLEKKLELEEAYGNDVTQIEEQLFQKKKELYGEDSDEFKELLREKELEEAKSARIRREKAVERELKYQNDLKAARESVNTTDVDDSPIPGEDLDLDVDEADSEQMIYVDGKFMTMSKFKLAQELGTVSKLEAIEAQLAMTKEGSDEYLRLQKQQADAEIEIEEAKTNAKVELAGKVSETLMSLSALAGEQTVVGKALGVVSATIDTYVGANKALAQGGIFGIASAAGIIATGLANVRQIMSTKVPSIQGQPLGTPAQPPTMSIPQATFQPQQVQNVGTVLNGNQNDQRVYVTESDITETQRKVQVTESTSVV